MIDITPLKIYFLDFQVFEFKANHDIYDYISL